MARRFSVVALALLISAASAAGQVSTTKPVWGTPVLSGTLPIDASEASEVLTVDLNGDGLRDAVIGALDNESTRPLPPVFLLNHGNGRFVDATGQLFLGQPPLDEWDRELLTADFNGDGRPDILIADHGHANDNDPNQPRNGSQDHLILSTSDGHFVDASQNLPQQRSFTHSAAVADVNGDGAPDIFENNLGCCGLDHVQAEILLNDGTGHFAVAPGRLHGVLTDMYGNTHSYACAFVDVNGDGSPDLVLGGSEHEDASQILLNDGHGNFTFSTTLPPTTGPPGNAFVIDMKAADVNGDGAPDLIFAESLTDPFYIGTNIQVLMNDGHGHFTDQTATRLPDPPQAKSWPDRVLVEDVNDDGKPDLTVQYASKGIVLEVDPTVVYLNDNGIFRRITPPTDGYQPNNGGPIGYVNGAGPHALFSVESRPIPEGPSRYYVTPQLVPPAAPTNVHATRIRTGVRISWRRVATATGYQVRRGGKLLATTTTTSYVDRRGRHRARYTVRSVNAAGVSADSAVAS